MKLNSLYTERPCWVHGALILLTTLVSAMLHPCTARSDRAQLHQYRYPTSTAPTPLIVGLSRYRGWDYLAHRLRNLGVSEHDVASIYRDPRMPRFSFVPFKLKPVEHPSIYNGFATPKNYMLGAEFIRRHTRDFDHIENTLGVPREAIAAILVVESRIGQFTGNHMVLYRLSRVASVADPENLKENFARMSSLDPSVTFEEVEARARYLEKRFSPEIPALIEIGKRNRIDILGLKGSIAGAFGIPQFLPTAFTRFAADGDKNGFISLFNEKDALWSTARYLASYGYRIDSPLEKRREVIWHYNKSEAYIDTVLAVADGIRRVLTTGGVTPTKVTYKVKRR